MRRLAARLALAAVLAPSVARSDPPPEIPELVWIVGTQGAPADSSLRAAFDQGLKLGLQVAQLRTEHPARRWSRWEPGRPIENRFRQLFGTTGEGAWQLQMAFENPGTAPPGREKAPRDSAEAPEPPRPIVDVVLIIHSPAMIQANARPMPVRWRLAASAAPASAEAYARALGRTASLLALEHMHHLIEVLPEGDRLTTDGFDRAAILETVPSPRR